MGLVRALVDSAARFGSELLPIGYRARDIAWVVNIDPLRPRAPTVTKRSRGELTLNVPDTPSDRTSGKVSPTLLVDKPSYALGRPGKNENADSAKEEHQSFVDLIKKAGEKCADQRLREVVRLTGDQGLLDGLKLSPAPNPSDLIAFQVAAEPWLTDGACLQSFWSDYMAERLAPTREGCVCCGHEGNIPRILPFKVRLFEYGVQISAFNKDAFCSHGSTTKSALNAPVCFRCAGTAVQVAQHLLKLDDGASGRHAVVLARDDTKGQAKQPLRNHIAVFWTKDPVELASPDISQDAKRPATLEDAVRLPLDDSEDAISLSGLPAYASQMRALLEAPLKGGVHAADLASNRFYLGVLSPNKSRLVVREWLEQDVGPVRDHLKRYIGALQILHPEGRGVWFPPLSSMLRALRSETSARRESQERGRLPQVAPDFMRALIRCMYAGQAPPGALLTQAVRCFRVPDPPTDDTGQRDRQMLRRMAMAAAMKLVLTHQGTEEERRAMEELKTEHDERTDYKRLAPYQCGRLLAVLEAIQRRASSSGRGVNTTQVDRFYGAASTAPASVFANLIGMATKAHLPKLRREGKELIHTRSASDHAVNVNDLMTETCDAIDTAGGFPPPLTPEEQAQFALGFYHQRADLAAHPKSATKGQKNGGTQ